MDSWRWNLCLGAFKCLAEKCDSAAGVVTVTVVVVSGIALFVMIQSVMIKSMMTFSLKMQIIYIYISMKIIAYYKFALTALKI